MSRVGRIAPLSGLVFAVLFGLGSAMWALDQPSRGAESDEIVRFFDGSSTEILIGGTMSLVSLVFLVWFGAVLRERLLAAEGSERSGLPMVAFAGAVLMAAAGLAAETINMAGAMAARDGQLTADAAQTYFDLSYAFGAHAAGVTVAMIALPTGFTALRTGRLLPRWAAWFALVLGAVMLTPAILLNRAVFFVIYSAIVIGFGALSLHLDRSTRHSTFV